MKTKIKKIDYEFYNGFLMLTTYEDGTTKLEKIDSPGKYVKRMLKEKGITIKL